MDKFLVIEITTDEYKKLVRENENMRCELEFLKLLIKIVENNKEMN